MPPLEAPSVPIVYQLLKSVGHSTMALAEVVMPYLNSPNDLTWRGPLAAYRSRMQSALDGLDAVPMRDDWKPTNRSILQNNIAFMDECLKNNVITLEALAGICQEAGAASEGEHRLGGADPGRALDGRDRRLEADARRRLGQDLRAPATRSTSPARTTSCSACSPSSSGPQAINDRLMLIETISFTTTPDDMLESLTRIIADRSVGAAFFGNYYLMDFELMGGDARQAIIDEDAKRNIPVNLPPQVPFGSHQWPTLITPGTGPEDAGGPSVRPTHRNAHRRSRRLWAASAPSRPGWRSCSASAFLR